MVTNSIGAEQSDEVLCALFQGGNAAVGNRIAERYIPLVRKRANSFRNAGVETEDLAQEGMIGLLYAMRAYEPTHGAAFATFAYTCITNRMLSSIASAGRTLSAVSFETVWGNSNEYPLLSNEDPQKILIDREQAVRWRDSAFQNLSDFEKEALQRYLNGDTYQEMAASLQTSAKAVDNALQRVRRKLRASGDFPSLTIQMQAERLQK